MKQSDIVEIPINIGRNFKVCVVIIRYCGEL